MGNTREGAKRWKEIIGESKGERERKEEDRVMDASKREESGR
jgi:hypothetical protein